jgi:DNA-binding XRE family transcriptional regulator
MKLRAAREVSKKTQKQAANDAGIPERLYQAYEYDEREPRARMAVRVAGAVGSTVEAIWGEEQQNPPGGNPAQHNAEPV